MLILCVLSDHENNFFATKTYVHNKACVVVLLHISCEINETHSVNGTVTKSVSKHRYLRGQLPTILLGCE